MNSSVIITKASGDRVAFAPEKLENSLRRAGASDAAIEDIKKKVLGQLFEGITTREIYHIAFDLLKNKTSHIAAKYKLKHAIMELGPSGFPFEKYFAELLKHQGYKTRVGEIVQGHCVTHEIDVIAENSHKQFMVECKFHNQSGYVCDVKIPLYIQSRFIDVRSEWEKNPDHGKKTYQGWVVTNTKFTTDAIQYGNCMGLHLVGWDYPLRGSLRDQIDQSGLYPLTCLTTLSETEKEKLLKMDIVLCRQLNANPSILQKINLAAERVEHVLAESAQVCAGNVV
jgi:hypothetical protein